FEAEGALPIEHYLSVFARGLGIEFEDRYKTFRLWEDPERVLAETTPCQQANGVDPSRARELIQKTFGRITKAPAEGNAPASYPPRPATAREAVLEIGLFTEFDAR